MTTHHDPTVNPAIAQGDWTAEDQQTREPAPLETVTPETVTPAPVAEERADAGLIAEDQLTGLRARWDHVQASFVDDPRDCVQKADGLVTDVIEQLTSNFASTRSGLEQQWSRGEDASTEDLRVALKRYRDFFDRLLAV